MAQSEGQNWGIFGEGYDLASKSADGCTKTVREILDSFGGREALLIQNEAKNLITQLRENNGSEPILLARNRVRDIVCRVKHKEDKNILNTSVLMRGFKYHVEMTFSSLFDLESM